MACIPIRQLDKQFKYGSILARVSRMWEFRGGKDDGELKHVDLVLIDQEGTPIYAEINAYVAQKTSIKLVEGDVYMFSRFRVVDAKPRFIPFESKFMIQITHLTIIEKPTAATPNIPRYVYNLSNLSDVSSLVGENKCFIDIIGLITEVGEADLKLIARQPKPTLRRQVTIEDTRQNQAKVYLWGERATEFDADAVSAMSENQHVVVIFVGLLAKGYQVGDSFSGNSSCRWYINPDVPEVRMFLNGLKNEPKPIKRLPPNPDVQVQQERPEPKLMSLADISATNPYDFPREGFRCVVTLIRYNADQGWHFPSCNKCSRTSHPYGSGFKCSRDGCTGYKFKYKPCYTASDGTAELDLVFFDDAGRDLIGKEVAHMMRLCRNSGPVPSDIAEPVGQKYQFVIAVTGKAFERIDYSYEVKKVEHAYGRQPGLPPVEQPAPQPAQLPSTTDVNLADKPLAQDQLQITHPTATPPPPPASPVVTPIAVTTQSSKPQEANKETPARRRLAYKTSNVTDDTQPAQDITAPLDDISDTTDDSDNPSAEKSKNPPPSKKRRNV